MKNIINILETNKYSINIESDYQDKNRVNNYYPTYKTLRLLEKFLLMIENKKASSVLLSGAYGTGKSYLTSILLNIADEKFLIKDYKGFLEKSNQKYDIREILKRYQKKKYLIVFGDSNGENYWQSILLGIYRSAKRENIELNLSTDFQIIEKKIENWSLNYKETHEVFIKKLVSRNIEEKFFRFLKEKNKKAIDLFSELYSDIFAGEKFVSLEKISSIEELISDVEEQAINLGYEGVIYVFDEFGRYLETGINNIDVKEIQDMSEYCNADNSSNLLMITHKDVFQYTNQLKNQENLEEWEKVSGRFLKEHLSYEKVNVMDILGEILQKNNYENHRKENIKEFEKKEILLKETGVSPKDEKTELEKYYPLDYIGATILPDLSQKLAQNERSLFAYVCGNEEKGLKNTILTTREMFIGLDSLYEYFEDNFKFLKSESSEYKVYINSKNLLSNLNEEEKLEAKFIKSLAMIYIYNKFSDLEPTAEVMRAILNIEDLEELTTKLKDKNLVSYKAHYNHYKLTEDINININKDIEEYVENKLGNFDYMKTLEENLELTTYYPLLYNDKHKITRYLGRYYLDVSNIEKLEELEKNKVEDGRIIYLTNIEGNKNYFKIKKMLLKKDIILISNEDNKKLDILDLIKELETIKKLKEDIKYSEESVAKNELETYELEVIERLKEEMKMYFYNGIIANKENLNKLNLMNYVSNYLEKKYPKYIGINYELINKNNLSFPMKKARHDILIKLQNQEILNEDYFNKTTAEGSVARILLKNEGIYSFLTGQIDLKKSIYENLYNDLLKDIQAEKMNFEDIYKKYSSNESKYGVRKGILTFVIGLLIIKNSQFIGMSVKTTNGEIELDLKVLDEIEKTPNKYEISYYHMGGEEIQYVDELLDIFELYTPKNNSTGVNKVLAGMKNYVMSLPRYINGIFLSENRNLNKLLSGIFSVNNGREFCLREIPKTYKKEVNLKGIVEKIKSDLEELKKSKSNFINDLIEFIVSAFGLNKTIKGTIKELKNQTSLNEMENYIVSLEDYSDEEILKKITEKIKGFSYENWRSKKEIDEFKKLFTLEIEKEGKNQVGALSGNIKIEHKEQSININMNVEESMHGKLLKNKLKATIKNMGSSINDEEMKRIFMEFLLGEN